MPTPRPVGHGFSSSPPPSGTHSPYSWRMSGRLASQPSAGALACDRPDRIPVAGRHLLGQGALGRCGRPAAVRAAGRRGAGGGGRRIGRPAARPAGEPGVAGRMAGGLAAAHHRGRCRRPGGHPRLSRHHHDHVCLHRPHLPALAFAGLRPPRRGGLRGGRRQGAAGRVDQRAAGGGNVGHRRRGAGLADRPARRAERAVAQGGPHRRADSTVGPQHARAPSLGARQRVGRRRHRSR